MAHRFDQLRTRLDGLRASLRRRSRRLLSLSDVTDRLAVNGHRYLGTLSVPIEQIRGSANPGRCHDFDADFRPLNERVRTRWVGVAQAWQRLAALPPVSLIQVGDIFFVQDGHHRISVARSYGQLEITANVTALDLAPLPAPEAPLALRAA